VRRFKTITKTFDNTELLGQEDENLANGKQNGNLIFPLETYISLLTNEGKK